MKDEEYLSERIRQPIDMLNKISKYLPVHNPMLDHDKVFLKHA